MAIDLAVAPASSVFASRLSSSDARATVAASMAEGAVVVWIDGSSAPSLFVDLVPHDPQPPHPATAPSAHTENASSQRMRLQVAERTDASKPAASGACACGDGSRAAWLTMRSARMLALVAMGACACIDSATTFGLRRCICPGASGIEWIVGRCAICCDEDKEARGAHERDCEEAKKAAAPDPVH